MSSPHGQSGPSISAGSFLSRPAWCRRCAWIGGRCVAGSPDDCAEPADPSAVDYYDEQVGFEGSCGNGPSSSCPGLRAAIERYAAAHNAATRDVKPPGGISTARLLVIRDHWKNVGMGFMPSHVATVLLFCLSAGIHLYVEVRAAHCTSLRARAHSHPTLT